MAQAKPKKTKQEPDQRECMVRIGIQADGPMVAVSVRGAVGTTTIHASRRALASVLGTVLLVCSDQLDDAEVTLRTVLR